MQWIIVLLLSPQKRTKWFFIPWSKNITVNPAPGASPALTALVVWPLAGATNHSTAGTAHWTKSTLPTQHNTGSVHHSSLKTQHSATRHTAGRAHHSTRSGQKSTLHTQHTTGSVHHRSLKTQHCTSKNTTCRVHLSPIHTMKVIFRKWNLWIFILPHVNAIVLGSSISMDWLQVAITIKDKGVIVIVTRLRSCCGTSSSSRYWV